MFKIDLREILVIVPFVLAYVSLLSCELFGIASSFILVIHLIIIFILLILKQSFKCSDVYFLYFFGIYLLLTNIVNNGGLGSIVTIFCPLLLVLVTEKIVLREKYINILQYSSVIAIFFLFFKSFDYARDWIWYRYNAINPNLMGLFVMLAFMIWFSFANTDDSVIYIKSVILLFLCILSIVNYGARGSLVTLLVYIMLNVIASKCINMRIYKILASVCLFVGIMFPVLYMGCYYDDINLHFLGKSFYTGRHIIWGNMFEAFQSDIYAFLYGLGSKVELWEGKNLNVHNNYWAIIVNFGFIGLFLYIYFIFKKINSIKYFNDIRIKKLLLMFLCTTFILAFIEVTTLYAVVYSFMYCSLSMAISIDGGLRRNERKDS